MARFGIAKKKQSKADTQRVTHQMLSSTLEKKVYEWRDKYVTRIDRDMTTAFPQLKDDLVAALLNNFNRLIKNKPKTFTKEVINPEILRWIEQVTVPIVNEAEQELVSVAIQNSELLDDDFQIDHLRALLIPGGLAIGGIGAVIAAFVFGITTTTFLFFWAQTLVSWPILLTLIALGGVLTSVGFTKLAKIKKGVADTFVKTFIPKIKDCLIGKGYTTKGKHHDSLKNQFQLAFEAAAEKLIENIKTDNHANTI